MTHNPMHTWKMRNRKLRAWVYSDGEQKMLYSDDFTFLSEFYEQLENYESYDQMDWINETDVIGQDIYEGDSVRVYGGIQEQGFWECDVSGIVEYRGTSYGIVNAEGIFYPFDIAFEAYDDIKYEVLGNVYDSSTGHEPLMGALPIKDDGIVPF